jgi:hypothetical protein
MGIQSIPQKFAGNFAVKLIKKIKGETTSVMKNFPMEHLGLSFT